MAVETVVTSSDDDGSTDTRGTQKMTGVNYIEFAPGLGTRGSFIYSRLSTNHLGKLTIGKSTVRNVNELGRHVSTR